MNGSPVLELRQVPVVASDAATELDNSLSGREVTFDAVTQIIDWLHEEACQLRRRACTQLSPLAMRDLVAPGREDITHVDDLATELDGASRRLRQTVMAICDGNKEFTVEARDFMLKLFAFSYQQVAPRRTRRLLFA